MKKTYTQIIEKCGNEGETWFTFLQEQGNEKFISNLKKTIENFEEEMEGGDSEIKIGNSNLSEEDVNLCEKLFNEYMDGYMSFITITSEVVKVDWDKISDFDEFMEIYYKGGLFES